MTLRRAVLSALSICLAAAPALPVRAITGGVPALGAPSQRPAPTPHPVPGPKPGRGTRRPPLPTLTPLSSIPRECTSITSDGETLSAIARLYRTSVDDLRSWNGLRGAVIHPGDRLTIRN